MTYIPLEDLLKKTGSIYKLTNLASKRALELNGGAQPLLKKKNFSKLSTVALKEIQEGKISYKEVK
jgi:DNA-directed RNA polymerase omega subunit